MSDDLVKRLRVRWDWSDNEAEINDKIDQRTEAADRIEELEAQNTEAMREAEGLAKAIHRRFYQEQAPQWKPLEYVAGIVSQIDNMTAGMAARIEELEAENRHLRIMLDSYGRLSTHKTPLTKLRGVSREADEYVKTKTRAAQVKGQTDE